MSAQGAEARPDGQIRLLIDHSGPNRKDSATRSATAKQFYFVEPGPIDHYRKRGAVRWACVKCHEQAATEHDNPRRPGAEIGTIAGKIAG